MTALRYLPFVSRGLRKSGPPLHLTLFVTGVCNARCRHCFHWQEVAAGVPGPKLAQVRQLADSAARLGPLLWVSFGGGEPFLRADLPELAAAFGRHGLRHLAIPTNGLVEKTQHEHVAAIVAGNPQTCLTVSVSFDGPPGIHDSIRQVTDGHARAAASVRRYREQARELRDARGTPSAARSPQAPGAFGVGLILTVTSENQHVLADHLEDLVDELRPDNVTINLARGTPMEPHLLEVDLARYREVVERKRLLMERGLLPYFHYPLARLAVARDRRMYSHIERVAAGDDSDHLPCTAGSLSAVIFENGEVHPCEILGRPLGNLNETDWDLGPIWASATAGALRDEIRDTRCACTWECAQADNVLFQPRQWPGLLADMAGLSSARRAAPPTAPRARHPSVPPRSPHS